MDEPVRIGAIPRWTKGDPEDVLHLLPIVDLLMGAAWADGEIDEREGEKVRELLRQLTGTDELPLSLEGYIVSFEPERFDLGKTVAVFEDLTPRERRRLVAMVREVVDANDALDLAEHRFVVALVLALALTDDVAGHLYIQVAPGLHGWAKRLFDVLFSGTFLLLAWPILIALAIGVKVTSRGPVFFRQKRYGREATEIGVLKFRTMRVHDDVQVKQATKNDPRITRFGAFLRRTSLDELPQFLNVLGGSMSVVGPRPHAVAHNEQYRTQILEYMVRHSAKPGITGWAQVNGWRGETDTIEKMVGRVEHDLEYLTRWTFWFDVKIVWLTVFGSDVRKNAY